MSLVVMGGNVYSNASWASCSVAGKITHPVTFYYAEEIQIDSSLPLYSNLGNFRIQTTTTVKDILSCTNNDPKIVFAPDRPLHSPGIYETGISGIGMKVSFIGPYLSGEAPATFQLSDTEVELPNYLISFITLIKIGYIPTGGQISPGSMSKGQVVNYGNLLVWNEFLERPLTVKLNRPTCVTNTPHFTVNLGDVSLSDFNAGGRTTPKNFSIDLNCSGGSFSTDVYVTLSDANNPANATRQLGLSPDSKAQGIALEVNNRLGLVSFGPDLEGLGNPGQWLDGATGVGSFSIPLSVNYVRLPGPIKGGTANSGVTYTLNYD